MAIDVTSVHLPLAVSGANVAYSDVDRALGRSIARETAGFEGRWGSAGRPLELDVELIEAHAEYAGGRLVVRLTTRSTLRDRAGNRYIAQTYARGSDSATVVVDQGGAVVRSATDAVGRRLAGWLAGLDL